MGRPRRKDKKKDAHMNVTLSATTFDAPALSPVIPVRRNRSGEARDPSVAGASSRTDSGFGTNLPVKAASAELQAPKS